MLDGTEEIRAYSPNSGDLARRFLVGDAFRLTVGSVLG
jgi:hypothetical protein